MEKRGIYLVYKGAKIRLLIRYHARQKKVTYLGKRKRTLDRNLDLHKEMSKSTQNGKYVGKYKRCKKSF